MGRLAGQAMAGRTVSYDHLPFFILTCSSLDTRRLGRWMPVWKWWQTEGALSQGRDLLPRSGRVRGVLLRNIWEQVESATKLIAEAGPFSAKDLKDRLPA